MSAFLGFIVLFFIGISFVLVLGLYPFKTKDQRNKTGFTFALLFFMSFLFIVPISNLTRDTGIKRMRVDVQELDSKIVYENGGRITKDGNSSCYDLVYVRLIPCEVNNNLTIWPKEFEDFFLYARADEVPTNKFLYVKMVPGVQNRKILVPWSIAEFAK